MVQAMIRLALLAVLGVLLCFPVQAADPAWKAGFASVSITPTKPMWMSGYASRTAPAEGTETELFARAAVLTPAQGPTLVLVSLDLVGIDRALGERINQLIREKHKLDSASICLAISHTHCGPVVGSTLRSMYFLSDNQAQLVSDYTKALPEKILAAVDAAFAKREAVTLATGRGICGFAVNRRENKEPDVPALRAKGEMLKGPVDHDVPVLVATSEKGKILGVLFGYACHATTLSYQKWNADWPGYAATAIEAKNPGAVACFFAGCGADQNPIPRRSLELAKQYGQQLADAVQQVIKQAGSPLPGKTSSVRAEIDLPLHEIPTRDRLIEESTNKDKYVAARAKMLLDQLAREAIPKSYPYPIQTWKIGGQTLVALGGEVVVDYSLRLKKELGADLWVMGYANDVMAYIPSARVLKEGGYEGERSMIYYGLPSVWGNSVEELIVKEVTRQVQTK
jgi:hypothetical protein